MHTPLDAESKSMIAQTLRRFVDDAYEFTGRRARLSQAAVDYRVHWPTLAELGILALPFDESAGGLSGSAVDVADAIRVMAGGLILEPFAEAAVVAGGVLASGADQGRSSDAVAALVGGESLTILVGGRDGLPDRVLCTQAEAGIALSGTVRVVPYAAQADHWLVAAEDAQGRCLLIRIGAPASAADIAGYRLMDGRPAADVRFDGRMLSEATVWLAGDAARAALQRASCDAVNACCADAVGIMGHLLAITGEYLRTRVQFGVTLGSFQALQHRYADMHMAFAESRAIARALAASLDGSDEAQQLWLRFAASSVITPAARLLGHEAIQMHGGMGVTDELIVSHYNARLVVLTSMLRTWVPQDVRLPA